MHLVDLFEAASPASVSPMLILADLSIACPDEQTARAILDAAQDENIEASLNGRSVVFKTLRDLTKGVEEAEFVLGRAVASREDERMAWIASLPHGSFAGTLYRGERTLRAQGYASDPGDLGAGRYFTSNKHTAKNYGTVGSHEVRFMNAALLMKAEQMVSLLDHVMLFYRTIRGLNRLAGADQMRADMLKAGIEGLIVADYDSGKGHITVVDYRSRPPR